MPANQGQLSRYGAIAKPLPDLAIGSKLFLVSDSDDTTVGPLNISDEFAPDISGVVRVYTTIQAAVNASSSNRGDLIMVLPGYDQSITAADSWNTAGVTIMGYGKGRQSPTLRYTGKAGSVGVSASNIRVTGLRFLSATDSVALGVFLDTAFEGIKFDNNVFDFDTATNDFRTMLRVGSRRSLIENNRFIAEDTAGCGAGIRFKGGAPSFTSVKNNFFYGQFDTVGDSSDGACPIGQDTTDTADTNFSGLLIENNVIVNTDTAAARMIRMSAGYTVRGIAKGNFFANFDSSSADSTKVASNSQAGSGLRFIGNHMNSDSGTERLVGDTAVVANA